MKGRVIVVKQTGERYWKVRRFRTVLQAERWLGRLKDQEAVRSGRYSIDAPEGFKGGSESR